MNRRAFLSLGGLALAACAPQGPPVAAERVEPAAAPREGERWRYRYSSRWANVAPRELDVEVVAVTERWIRDRMSGPGLAADERNFDGTLAAVTRPLGGGFAAVEFSPYLQAFAALQPGMTWHQVGMPPDVFPLLPWATRARVRGTERVTVAAGTFEAARLEIVGSRPAHQADDAADPVLVNEFVWYAPAVRRVVLHTRMTQAALFNVLDDDRYELVEHRRAG